MSVTVQELAARSSAGMGQIVVARAPLKMMAVLGSCIGVVLYHRRLGLAALGHVVLPESAGRAGSPGKFADTAVPHMVKLLTGEGANVGGLNAKLAGGSSMFGDNGPMQIGEANRDAILKALKTYNIAVVAEHLGGNKGRRVTFDPATCELAIEIVGQGREVI